MICKSTKSLTIKQESYIFAFGKRAKVSRSKPFKLLSDENTHHVLRRQTEAVK